jgi:hypothetical protein
MVKVGQHLGEDQPLLSAEFIGSGITTGVFS